MQPINQDGYDRLQSECRSWHIPAHDRLDLHASVIATSTRRRENSLEHLSENVRVAYETSKR
jgi:hypothetical protein